MELPPVRYATTRDGVAIAYSSVGRGAPLLYCRCPAGPGFSTVQSMDELDPWFAELAERFQLITFDYRGGGLSERGDQPLSFATLTLDMLAVLDDIGIERAHIQSELMASATTVQLAATHPERVGRLVMWHPMLAQSQRSADPRLANRWDRFFDSAQDDWEMFCLRLISESYETSAVTARAISGSWSRETAVEDFSEAWDPRGTYDAEPLLPRLQAKALLLQRKRDGYYRLTLDGAEVAARIPGAELRIVPGRDNFPYTDHPADVLAEVEQFLSEDAETGDQPRKSERVAAGVVVPSVLSDREAEVVSLVAEGLRNADIAARLGIARSTVQSHVHSALAKTELSNRIELTRYAYRSGLIATDSEM